MLIARHALRIGPFLDDSRRFVQGWPFFISSFWEARDMKQDHKESSNGLSGKRVLITGGAGFIGSHTAEALLDLGAEVGILDDFNDYYDPAIKRANIEDVKSRGGHVFVFEGDLCEPALLDEAVSGFEPSAIIHLAARAGVRPSIQYPALYARVNAEGTTLVLEAARKAGVKKVVVGSTSSIYGINSDIPFREDSAVLQQVSPYAASKLAAEGMAHVYHHLYGMDIPVLRFFTVYGPRQRPDMAIHHFTRLIDEGREVPMFGNGESRRDYTYVSDIVYGVVQAVTRPIGHAIINLGESTTVSLRRMIELIEKAVGKPARIKQLGDQPGDVPITYADVSRAKELLGYHPNVMIEEGIPLFVDWYRAMKNR
jgi:UDP-glucuronate 4-epimerase